MESPTRVRDLGGSERLKRSSKKVGVGPEIHSSMSLGTVHAFKGKLDASRDTEAYRSKTMKKELPSMEYARISIILTERDVPTVDCRVYHSSTFIIHAYHKSREVE